MNGLEFFQRSFKSIIAATAIATPAEVEPVDGHRSKIFMAARCIT
jgi:hypothetical protein